jgi:hypothetical protein
VFFLHVFGFVSFFFLYLLFFLLLHHRHQHGKAEELLQEE